MERSKACVFGLVAKMLRAELGDATDEPLPERWIELIRQLDEKERRKSDGSPAEPSRPAEKK
jgi:hypothetical protein